MTAEAKTHGLNGTLVEPDWPPIRDVEAASILAEYPALEGPCKVLTVSPRPLSAASVVATRDRRVFMKRHARAVRDVAGLDEEHRFMRHLLQHGGAVPEVLANRRGLTAIEWDEWTYEVHSIPAGLDVYEDAISWTPFFSAEHAFAAGRALAQMHRAAEGYDAPVRCGRALVAGITIFAQPDAKAAVGTYTAVRPGLREYLAKTGFATQALALLEPFHRELMPLLPGLAPLWTHNDFHPSNLFWSGTERTATVTAAIDFGLCDRTNAVHDLAHALERSVFDWLALMNAPHKLNEVAVHTDHLWALLGGYESVRHLTAVEAHALAPMLALCHAEFALSEGDYFLRVLHDEEKARVACEDYLVTHARWWRGPGAEVLNRLRAWAENRAKEDEVQL